MTPLAIVLITASAGLHATWNAIAKKSGASIAFYATLGLIGMAWSLSVQFFSPLRYLSQPSAFYAWLAAMLASEFLNAFGLRSAYRALDMSVAYPMMRSIPILLLTAATAAFGLGSPLSARSAAGMCLVFLGCVMIPLRRFSDFKPSRYLDRSFGYILLVALGTTGYTLCDSQAQKAMAEGAAAAGIAVSRPLLALTYYSFRAMTLTPALWLAVALGRGTRAEAAELWRNRSWTPLAAGCCSSLTYVLVLMAMNFVSNVAYVQAFRQIGLLFGLVEAVFVLKERCAAPKVAGTALILAGLAVIALASMP